MVEGLIAKYAKKFTSNDEKREIFQGIHYAEDNSVCMTNRFTLLRIREGHKLPSPVTVHHKKGTPIKDAYPDVTRYIPENWTSELYFCDKDAIENALNVAKTAFAVARFVNNVTNPVELFINENGDIPGIARLMRTSSDPRVEFVIDFGQNLMRTSSVRTLNADYLVNALSVFLDARSPEVYIRMNDQLDPIWLTDDTKIDVIIQPINWHKHVAGKEESQE